MILRLIKRLSVFCHHMVILVRILLVSQLTSLHLVLDTHILYQRPLAIMDDHLLSVDVSTIYLLFNFLFRYLFKVLEQIQTVTLGSYLLAWWVLYVQTRKLFAELQFIFTKLMSLLSLRNYYGPVFYERGLWQINRLVVSRHVKIEWKGQLQYLFAVTRIWIIYDDIRWWCGNNVNWLMTIIWFHLHEFVFKSIYLQ